ncbi:MAG: FadR family transcriptional regulator [Sphingomonas bacterium]|jgi:GntR family transcriptional repressor for pyruvate dehydrogenase complex|uniref:FadR/GntR family transcriptional regulator n=1 Tax=Sphingomonas bacterium TaxID=1895847 RepID=UPI00261CF963|nr:FadR/GntR family transcriptional regulator [Sphingomonas bacterium]MDB5707745.1 FadR family transcriptional regulator [Sphingomonas bacterium]
MTTKAASLADDLVRQFERRIEAGDMPPGSRFPTEKAITDSFGVSRTVVREAFARLAARGLLESRQGSGAYVARGARYQAFQVTPEEMGEMDDVIKLLEMRMALETEIADLAASRRTDADMAEMRKWLELMRTSSDIDEAVAADMAFHRAIAAATRNDYYLRFMDFLGIRLVPPRRLYLKDRAETEHRAYARDIYRDHEAILVAIEAQEPARARRAARRHMQKSLERHRQRRAAEEQETAV